jgi:hypothetical protein
MKTLKLINISACWLGMGLFTACSSTPIVTAPEWIHSPTRTVDNGYIVYVGTGSGPNPENAQFKAEGMALEDIANECSFIPKGTRVEDRFAEKGEHDSTAWVKVALEFQECDQASKTTEPLEIKRLASASFTAQMKRYQDFNETGETPASDELTVLTPPTTISPAPTRASGWSESTHFYVIRQYVAYQNEVVILSPPSAYQPGSPEAKVYTKRMQGPWQQVQTAIANNPQLKSAPQPWSAMPDRPKIVRPKTLEPKANAHAIPYSLPRKNSGDHQVGDGHHGRKGKHRKRKN